MTRTNKSQTALQHYLDGLLQEAKVEQYDEPRPVLVAQRPAAQVKVLPTLTSTVVEVKQEQVQEQKQKQEQIQEQLQQSPVVQEEKEARPEWSEQPFECLLFDVAGLTLAVPLVCLGSVHTLDDSRITPIFAQPEWFVGIMSTPQGNLKVLDTARWVMPERYSPELRDSFNYVISIDGCEWGLAVNQVRDSIMLNPDDVKWRSRRGQRAWLAGTVIEHMCALLDVSALATLIEDKDLSVDTKQAAKQ